MATTFTGNYQIKLIGTGLESGTWGTSTNENLKRIEQTLGGSKLSLDVESPGGGSDWDGSNKILTWVTDDTADAGTAGGSGRYKFVQFTGSPGADAYVYIRGSSPTEYPNRIYFVENATSGGFSLIFNNNVTKETNTYTVLNGAFAVIYAESSTNVVDNLLSTLQIENLVFPAAADISIVDGSTTALDILSGSGGTHSYLTFDTSNAKLIIGQETSELETLDIDTATIDVATQATDITVLDNTVSALSINEGTNSYIDIDTQNSSPRVVIGLETSDCETLQIDTETVTFAAQASDFFLKTNDTAALEVYETNTSGTKMLTFDTSTPKLIVPSGVELELDGTLNVDGTSDFSDAATFSAGVDIDGAGTMDNTVIGGTTHVAGKFSTLEATGLTTIGASGLLSTTTGYLNFETTTGTDGYGIRNNSGKVEAKDSGGGWGGLWTSGVVTGGGVYFELTGQVLTRGTNVQSAHSLGAAPRMVLGKIIVESGQTDAGYSAGDEVYLSAAGFHQGGATDSGIACGANATNVFYVIGDDSATPLGLLNKTSGAVVLLDESKWRLTLMAWL